MGLGASRTPEKRDSRSAFALQTSRFLWRARQDSNRRPSLFVVLLPMFSDIHWCPEVSLPKRLLFLAVRRRSLRFSFYCCPTAAIHS